MILPFRALRPPRDLVARVCAPPYDVVSTGEARTLAAGNPDCFLRISRPEIELADDIDPHLQEVYVRGRDNLEDFVQRGVLARDVEPGLLVYRQVMGSAVQTGVVGCASVKEYRRGVIATHEDTRHDKETDRTRHISVLRAHDEPVFLMHRPDAPGASDVAAIVEQVTEGEPEYDLTTADGVRHTLWTVTDGTTVGAMAGGFAEMPTLYVADGHHRSAAAARVYDESRAHADEHRAAGAGEFPVVVFPAEQLTVMAYHRVVRDLVGQDPVGFLAALRASFEVESAEGAPELGYHQFGVYLDGGWYRLTVRPGLVDEDDAIARLDVSVLQELVLGPWLGIIDPRTDERIAFVGGIRGTEELVRLVDSGEFAVAFAMHPTSTEEVMDVADMAEVMPPKSTWFEPKLRSGLFVHPLD
jgi:uncharacterized protein (DUF1015 family)